MSKKYKDNFIANVIILASVMICALPILPITFIIICIMYLLNIKGKYLIYIGLVLCVLISVVNISITKAFLIELFNIGELFILNILTGKLLQALLVYSNYTFFSWIMLIIISVIIAGYFLIRIERNEKYEKAGIVGLERKIENDFERIEVKPVKTQKQPQTLIGHNKSGKAIYCDDKAKHIFVCGTTGSGKTVLLSNYIKSGIEKNYGMLIVDGKGDIGEGSILQITKDMCKKKSKKLYVIDMNNPDNSCKYNPFINTNETVSKDMLINMTEWSEEHYKSNTERYLQRTIKLILENGERLSFDKIIEYLSSDNFQMLSSELVKQGKLTKDEHVKNLELIKSSAKIAENASSRFSTIAESEIGKIFDNDGIDITTALKENAVILFVLNPLLYPESSKALGRLILIDSKKAVSNLFGDHDKRKFFIFDEINVYASSVLLDLINKSRSAGVTCIPATQSLADLESAVKDSFKEQIIENCNNYIVLRQNSSKSAEEWAKTLGTAEKMKMTYKISNGEGTGQGSARKTREFIVHPDEIKNQAVGEAVYLSRDTGRCERIKIIKPF